MLLTQSGFAATLFYIAVTFLCIRRCTVCQAPVSVTSSPLFLFTSAEHSSAFVAVSPRSRLASISCDPTATCKDCRADQITDTSFDHRRRLRQADLAILINIPVYGYYNGGKPK